MNNDHGTDFADIALDDLLSMVDDAPIELGAGSGAGADRRIAIVGMAGRIGGCADLAAFWDLLRDGRTSGRALPAARGADLQEFLRLKGAQQAAAPLDYFRESFLDDVDRFDHRFFGIARQEANLMDPSQRLFLETAWTALEHAGYGGQSVKGSATGVFVGLSGDFGNAYRDIVRTQAPDAPEVAVVGNVRSIIASRIAYHLDLRGPSMLVDTACSSALVALHQACRALQAGDCEMALVGTVKVDLVPVAEQADRGVGIKAIAATMAHDGRTRTFDDDSDGTAGAEGVIAFVLKPLERALADGDTVHGVILGSAVNQDGQSMGITAPNSAAQESLIVSALQEAGIDAATVSYIEAHGTGTRLGDPVEVSGIQRAFRQFTARRQFCAIGSVKSNIGHMDCGAGLAGLAKVVLALQHRQLPPSLHFQKPNRNIAFPQSPLFVNDVLRPWRGSAGAPPRAGINSYGLSGTNCHVIVEAAPDAAPRAASGHGAHLLVLSAATDAALEQLCASYGRFLDRFDGAPLDLCYTAAVGRQHYAHRVAFTFTDLAQLRGMVDTVAGSAAPALDEAAKRQLDWQAQALCEAYRQAAPDARAALAAQAGALYAQGADLPWDQWFEAGAARRIALPTYPFARTRCWVATTEAGEQAAGRSAGKQLRHPLLDRCAARAPGLHLYEAMLGVDSHWELADHKVKGMYVLPGTALLEMVLAAAADLTGGALAPLQIEQLVFMRPFMLAEHQRKLLQLTLTEAGAGFQLRLASRSESDPHGWDVHAEGTLKLAAAPARAAIDIAALTATLPAALGLHRNEGARRGGLEVGERWNGSFQQGWGSLADDEFLVRLALPQAYRGEEAAYHFHPALLDTAVNAVNHLAGDGALYLPFAYKRLDVFKALPGEFYVHLRKHAGASALAFNLDIDIVDVHGDLCAHFHEYTIKQVPATELVRESVETHMHYVSLVPAAGAPAAAAPDGPILVIRDAGDAAFGDALRAAGAEVVEVVRGEAGLARAFAALEGQRFAGVLYALGVGAGRTLAPQPAATLHAFVDCIDAFAGHKLRCGGALVVLAPGAFQVAQADVPAQPHLAALAALARIVRIENPQLRVRCLDSDAAPSGPALLAELLDGEGADLAVYRAGVCHRERLDSVTRQARPRFAARADGIYLITGGFGALGLELATHMARKGPVNLALLSSTPLPPRQEWAAILGDEQASAATRASIGRVLALQELGARVECVGVDVSDSARMGRMLDQLRAGYGRINGVVHAAGRGGEGFLQTKTRERFDRVLAPKVDGARLLHELTLADELEFFVMFSSIVTVIRTPGQTDYTAANAYLDALAHYRRASGLPAISLVWPAWREVGMALEFGAVDEDQFLAPIDNAVGLDLLDQVLGDCGQLPPVLILSEINPRADLAKVDAQGLALPDAVRARLRRGAAERQARSGAAPASAVRLQGIDAPDEIALAVARIWSQVLGSTELGADDVFADHGGNSILTTQMYREFEKTYPGALDVVDLFTHTSIREQSAFLRKALGVASAAEVVPAPQETNMDQVLALLAKGSISQEDAEAMLLS
jgi:polyketide synthase PksN